MTDRIEVLRDVYAALGHWPDPPQEPTDNIWSQAKRSA